MTSAPEHTSFKRLAAEVTKAVTPTHTPCAHCSGQGWRAQRSGYYNLLPGVYEVVCDICGGFGWVVTEEGARP